MKVKVIKTDIKQQNSVVSITAPSFDTGIADAQTVHFSCTWRTSLLSSQLQNHYMVLSRLFSLNFFDTTLDNLSYLLSNVLKTEPNRFCFPHTMWPTAKVTATECGIGRGQWNMSPWQPGMKECSWAVCKQCQMLMFCRARWMPRWTNKTGCIQPHVTHTDHKGKVYQTDVVCWLLNVPATCKCISVTDLLQQFYKLSHWDTSWRSNFPSHPVTV